MSYFIRWDSFGKRYVVGSKNTYPDFSNTFETPSQAVAIHLRRFAMDNNAYLDSMRSYVRAIASNKERAELLKDALNYHPMSLAIRQTRELAIT